MFWLLRKSNPGPLCNDSSALTVRPRILPLFYFYYWTAFYLFGHVSMGYTLVQLHEKIKNFKAEEGTATNLIRFLYNLCSILSTSNIEPAIYSPEFAGKLKNVQFIPTPIFRKKFQRHCFKPSKMIWEISVSSQLGLLPLSKRIPVWKPNFLVFGVGRIELLVQRLNRRIFVSSADLYYMDFLQSRIRSPNHMPVIILYPMAKLLELEYSTTPIT